jgi:hypothetical protein
MIAKHLQSLQTAPFLFIGSGLSRRYIGLETWRALLQRFTVSLGHPFDYYFTKADGRLPGAASLIADDFHEHWWKHPDFEESRANAKPHLRGRDSCLKYEIARYISGKKYTHGLDPLLDQEITLLKKSMVDGIITTNWDLFLESVFPDFRVFVGQESVLFSNPQGIAEIYKIHGCVTEPLSLVLTEADYEDFSKKNPYLAAKLLAAFVEHPVIFLGYSLSDPNILAILGSLASCLSVEGMGKLKDRLIVVQWEASAKELTITNTYVQINSLNIPVTVVHTATFIPLFEAMTSVRRKFPARILRQMKEHIYDLVRTNDPTGRMQVVDIEDADKLSDLEVVYGVGVSKKIGAIGYSVIDIEDLLKDVMNQEDEYDPCRIITEIVPRSLKRTKYVPMFKYLQHAGLLRDGQLVEPAKRDSRIVEAVRCGRERLLPPQQYLKRRDETIKKYTGVADVAAKHDFKHSVMLILSLADDQLRAEELKLFILANMNNLVSSESFCQTYFRAVICLYDWIAYGRAA